MELGGVHVEERNVWGAETPLGPSMTLPALGLFIHHSVTDATDDDWMVEATDDFYGDMREIDRVGKTRFGRFPYSFGIHPNGSAGVGSGTNIGAHTANYNSRHFAFCMIGNYNEQPCNDVQVWHAGMMTAGLVKAGWMVPTFFIKGHRDVKATACPGNNVYLRIPEIREIARVLLSEPVPTPAPPPLPPKPNPVAWPGRYLKLKSPYMTGTDVRRFQESCRIGTGSPSTVDGVFGPKSDEATRNLQRWGHLAVDGVVGPKTWNLAEYLRSLKT